MNKTMCILLIMEKLQNKEAFLLGDLAEEFNVSRRTIIRYINEIKAYLKLKNIYSIKYCSSCKSFQLVKE